MIPKPEMFQFLICSPSGGKYTSTEMICIIDDSMIYLNDYGFENIRPMKSITNVYELLIFEVLVFRPIKIFSIMNNFGSNKYLHIQNILMI